MKFGIIDMSSLVHRYWHGHAIRLDSCGNGIHAVLAWKDDLEYLTKNFTHLAVAVDRGYTYRSAIYPPYKQNRDETDPDLTRQMELCESLCEHFSVLAVGVDGHEADDVIATLSARLRAAGKCDVTIYSQDKDMRQLLSPRIRMFTKKHGFYGERELMRDWEIRPDQVVDYQSLVGDSVDGVPGCPGIGPKTAGPLMRDYDSLDGIYSNLPALSPGVRKKLEEGQDMCFTSKALVTLKDDLEIPITGAETRVREKKPTLSGFLANLHDPTRSLNVSGGNNAEPPPF